MSYFAQKTLDMITNITLQSKFSRLMFKLLLLFRSYFVRISDPLVFYNLEGSRILMK
jgi:hypothetical protein